MTESKDQNENNELESLVQKLKHHFIRERREGVERAAELLQDPDYREDLLPLLEDLAAHDPIGNIRNLAHDVLESYARQYPSQVTSEDSKHTFGVKCPKCNYITYFNKWKVCTEEVVIVRHGDEEDGTMLDKILLNCGNCGQDMAIQVDCKGYR